MKDTEYLSKERGPEYVKYASPNLCHYWLPIIPSVSNLRPFQRQLNPTLFVGRNCTLFAIMFTRSVTVPVTYQVIINVC